MTAMDQMIEAACMANLNPLAEPSKTERERMRAALRAALPILGDELGLVYEDKVKAFLDPRYAIPQPTGSYSERHGCFELMTAFRARLAEIMEGG